MLMRVSIDHKCLLSISVGFCKTALEFSGNFGEVHLQGLEFVILADDPKAGPILGHRI